MPVKAKKTKAPKTEQLAEQNRVQRSLTIPVRVTALVEHDATLRLVGGILRNGSIAATNPHSLFSVHTGLVIQLREAYIAWKQGEEEAVPRFFQILTSYLQQAKGHLAHSMPDVPAEQQVQSLQDLVNRINQQLQASEKPVNAFEGVASYLLRLATAIPNYQ